MTNLITKIIFICFTTLIGNQLFAQSITLLSDSTTTNQTLCADWFITEIKYSIAGGATNVTINGLPNGITGVYNSGIYSITGLASPGTYTYTITTVGGTNPAVSSTGIINVNPNPKLVITDPAAVCLPNTVDLTSSSITNGSTGGGTLTYWSDQPNSPSLSTPSSISKSGIYYIKSTLGSCVDMKSVNVTINNCACPINLVITDPSTVCLPDSVDLTSSSITSGSTVGGTLTYWTDAAATSSLSWPVAVQASGTYYIKISNGICSDVKPVTVEINDCACPINLVITPPAAVCSPNTVDLTTSSITVGSSGGGTLSYWTDAAATTSLSSPTAVVTSGTYYIKSSDVNCSNVKSVIVTINTTPSLVITNPASVCSPNTVDLTSSTITTGSTGGGTLSYWTDAATTTSLTNPTSISVSGTYYIKSTLGSCSDVKPVITVINSTPLITSPSNLTICDSYTLPTITGTNLSGNQKYYNNSQALGGTQITGSLTSTQTVWVYDNQGTCSDEKSFVVTINTTPSLVISDPTPVCSPNTIDLTSSSITAGSTGGGTLSYWTDQLATVSLTNPSSVSVSGTYYIKIDNGICFDSKPVVVAVNSLPIITGSNSININETSQFTCVMQPAINTPWNSSNSGVASVTNSGLVTGISPGTSSIQYTSINGCTNVFIITVNNPTIILTSSSGTDNQTVCENSPITNITYSTTGVSGINIINLPTGLVTNLTANIINISGKASSAGTFNFTISTTQGIVHQGTIIVNPSPVLTITNPSPLTSPATVDITAPSITAGSSGNGTLTYWINPDASVPLTNPTAISMSGTYYIKSVLGNCSDTSFVTVTINKVSSPTTQLNAYVIPKGATQNGYCDGSAEVVVTSGTAPYTFLYSDNSTAIKAVGLCSGLKSVRVVDSNKDTLYLNFLISSPANQTTTKTLVDSTTIDSVFNSVVTNCVLNYSKIDSAKIINYTVLSNDSIRINWQAYFGIFNVTISSIYSMEKISKSGVYDFALQVYCPNKLSSGNFLIAYDKVFLTKKDITNVGINELKTNEFTIYPNPFSDNIFIKNNYGESSLVTLSDISGKILISKVLTSNEETIDTRVFSSGNYLLIIRNNKTVKTFSLIK